MTKPVNRFYKECKLDPPPGRNRPCSRSEMGTDDVGGGARGCLNFLCWCGTLSWRDCGIEHIEHLHEAFRRAVVTCDYLHVILGTVVALTAILAVVGH